MIEKLEINAIHAEVDDKLRKYVFKRIGKLDLYMSRKIRESAHAEVKLKDAKAKDRNQYTCEVILHLPHEVIMAKETTMNMYAAIDIVEATLKNRLKKYKEVHSIRPSRRMLNKLKRTPPPEG